MEIDQLLKEKRDEILRIADKYGAKNVRVFGSLARGDATPTSDVDFLVNFEPGRSLMDIGGMVMDLQDLLGRRVDIVEPEGLHWFIRDQVLKDAVSL